MRTKRLGESRENTWAIAPLAAFHGTDFFIIPITTKPKLTL